MADLIEFLRARLDEDEVQARRSKADNDMNPNLHIPAGWVDAVTARTLAEVEAKRRIIELHREWWTSDQNHCVCDEDECIYPCETLRLLALPYADHPDYRDEWRA